MEQFAELTSGLESQLAQRTALEALLIRLAKVSVDVSLDSVLEKLAMLSEDGQSPGSKESRPTQKIEQAPSPKNDETVAASTPKKSRAPNIQKKPAAPTAPAESTTDTRESDDLNPTEVKAALEDPHIAQVVDVFKGEIVEIQEEPGQSD